MPSEKTWSLCCYSAVPNTIATATMQESNPVKNPQPPGTISRYLDSRDKERGRNRPSVQSRSQEQARKIWVYCEKGGTVREIALTGTRTWKYSKRYTQKNQQTRDVRGSISWRINTI